jgi:hypothetical protein
VCTWQLTTGYVATGGKRPQIKSTSLKIIMVLIIEGTL